MPSDLTLYYNLHVLCFIELNNSVNINSLPRIVNDKYFKCIEFKRNQEEIKFGIIIYESEKVNKIKKDYILFYIPNSLFKNDYRNCCIINSFKMNNEYSNLTFQLKNKQNSNKLKKLYALKPIFKLKRNSANKDNHWNFINIFNEYFCFCVGFNCLYYVSKNCKYFYYIYLIDINRNVYKKSDFLLMDFIFKKFSSDDVYPIFEEMINNNLNAHYITEKKEIYEKYCQKKKICDLVIDVDVKNTKINDEFLEKHLTLILKLKHVVSSVGVDINYINNLFYNIEYITYICVGHGISYFKYYLYEEYYGPQNFDKLLIPNSDILLSVPLNYGWENRNLIKLNLPRWDKYNVNFNQVIPISNVTSQSILVMFTWRESEKNKKISSYYINNILKLLSNEKLINIIFNNHLTLYFTLHHKLLKFKNHFKKIKNIIYIEENEISKCLSKINLLISDYSSIIFDMIYRKKPYIIYIPDAEDPNINKIYKNNTYEVINKFKTNNFKFENVYFDIESVVNKTKFYIDNSFKLEPKIKQFYDTFKFKNENATIEFINYLLRMK